MVVFSSGMKPVLTIHRNTPCKRTCYQGNSRLPSGFSLVFFLFLFIITATGCKNAPDIPDLPCFIFYWEIAGTYEEICLCSEIMRLGDIADITDCSPEIDPDRIETRIFGESTSFLLASGIDGDLLDCLYRDPLISIPPEPGLCWRDTSTLILPPPSEPVTMITKCTIEETGLELSDLFGHTFDNVMRLHVEDDQDQTAADYYFAPGIGIVQFSRRYISFDYETGGELESWDIVENRDCDCNNLAENFFPEGHDNTWIWRLHGQVHEISRTYTIVGKVCAGESESAPGNGSGHRPLHLINSEEFVTEKAFATMIRIKIDSPGPGSISIHSPNGQLVRNLYSGSFPYGSCCFFWDGKDETGVPSAPGPYLALVEKNGAIRFNRFTCLR